MKAEEVSFIFLGNEGIVEVPFFQRGYVWNEDNWGDLLEDLLNRSKNHFLGSLILKQHDPVSGSPKCVSVIDGQQRLTTLSILVKALYDHFSPALKQTGESSLRSVLFYKLSPTAKEFHVKIRHSHVDAGPYEKVIRAGLDGNPQLVIDHGAESQSRILQCYSYFHHRIQEAQDAEREALFNRILDSENKMLVAIDLKNQDNEQAIFDTINSAGVRLSCADTIKNALFQRAVETMGRSRAIELYKTTWEKAFLLDPEALEYWETERQTGRLKRDNIEILLHSIAVIKGFYNPETDTLSDLSDRYKSQIRQVADETQLRALVDEIVRYAEIYRTKIPVTDKSELFNFAEGTRRLLFILDALEISTFHPFILYSFKKYEHDNSTLAKLLLNLEKLVIRRMVVRAETKSYNKLCRELIQSPDSIGKKAAEITNIQLSSGLRGISNKFASLLLFWIELRRRHLDSKRDIKDLKYVYTLEHVMPQKWEEHWSDIPDKKDAKGTKLSSEDAKKDRAEKVYWIGNMTLLTSALNSSLRNYRFEKKVTGEGRKKGMKDYAELDITRDDIIAPFDGGDKTWDEQKIISRTAKLEGEFKTIWGV
ncbi:MAG: DUF262 domain-containing HNH endonuclease family protein [Elusimicrobia bacterium]|nr:DUF262 domain-containing HNH endonuclease family protein [Elusimicrobiota bacterium]